MSGDLAKPSEAIPKGTLWGILITFISYVGLLWMIGASCQVCADDEENRYCGNGSKDAVTEFGILGGSQWTKEI